MPAQKPDPAAARHADAGSPSAAWGGLLATVIAVGIGAISMAWFGRDPTILGLEAATPFVAAALSNTAWTVFAGAVAMSVVASVGDYDHRLGERDVDALLVGVLVATVTAALAAAVRRRRIRQLRDSRTVAEVVQQTLLRTPPPAIDDVLIAAHYDSAARAAQVGGDVYEVMSTPYGLRALLGDVRGKGLPAVRLASATVGAFREACFQQETLLGLAEQLDASLSRQAGPEDFVTAVIVQVEADAVGIVACGHPPPFLIRGGNVEVLRPDAHSLPLGLGVAPSCQRVPFAPGDRLLLYTDGVSEARRRRKFFDLAGEAARLDEDDPAEFLRRLARRLARWSRRSGSDDVAMLVLQRVPREVAPGGLDDLFGSPSPPGDDLVDRAPAQPTAADASGGSTA